MNHHVSSLDGGNGNNKAKQVGGYLQSYGDAHNPGPGTGGLSMINIKPLGGFFRQPKGICMNDMPLLETYTNIIIINQT